MDHDAEALDCLQRIALALECINRNVYRLTELFQDVIEAQAEEV